MYPQMPLWHGHAQQLAVCAKSTLKPRLLLAPLLGTAMGTVKPKTQIPEMAVTAPATQAGQVSTVTCLQSARLKWTVLAMAPPQTKTRPMGVSAIAPTASQALAAVCLHRAHLWIAPIMAPPLTLIKQTGVFAIAQEVSQGTIAPLHRRVMQKPTAMVTVTPVISIGPTAARANAQMSTLVCLAVYLHAAPTPIVTTMVSVTTWTKQTVAHASACLVTLVMIVQFHHHAKPEQLRQIPQVRRIPMLTVLMLIQQMMTTTLVIAVVMARPLTWTEPMAVIAIAPMTTLAVTAPSRQCHALSCTLSENTTL